MIKKYIEFAIENGFKLLEYGFKLDNLDYLNDIYIQSNFIKQTNCKNYYAITDIITSKEFIEAVARGIEKKLKNNLELYIYINDNMWDGHRFGNYTFDKTDLPEDICYNQAIAIRDNTLDTFIKSLLNNK